MFRVALDSTKESAHAGRRLRALSVIPLTETFTFCDCCQLECGNIERLAQHTAGRKHQRALLRAGGTVAELKADVETTNAAASSIAQKKQQYRELHARGDPAVDSMIPIAPHREALVRSQRTRILRGANSSLALGCSL